MRFIANSLGRELKPDREHQENHAEFSQVFGRIHVSHQIQRMRTDDTTNKQVAEDRRQIEAPKDNHGQNRGAEQKEDE
jgi:hypothetical protein